MNMELLYAFRYAFVAGLAVAIACSLLSPLVVYKRMAFIGEGVQSRRLRRHRAGPAG